VENVLDFQVTCK